VFTRIYSVAVPRLEHRTKADLVYENLRPRILSGEFAPGSRLAIATVAEELGVSEIPVRESIKRLEAEGLLTFIAHKGAIVTELTREQIEELFVIRMQLESIAMIRAAKALTPEQIDGLRGTLAAMAEAEAAEDADEASRLHHDFHMQIYQAQSYKRLVALITDLWDATNWAGKVFATGRTGAATAAEHEPIVDALAAGDGETAAALHRAQKRKAVMWLTEDLEESVV
jgi:DNA-binding GntR family transcriptional regulator